MSEYFRAKHEGTGEVFQWCDTTLYCVIDTHTLKPERFGKHGAATGTLQEALDFVTVYERCAIVELKAIAKFIVE